MGLARRGNVVWLSMVLSGLALAAVVWVSWPEPTIRIVRLPYGESMPKSSIAAPERQEPVRTVAAVAPASQPDAAPEPELAAAEPEPSAEGPAAVGSELDDGYAESPESLGAEPLPGTGGAPPREEPPREDQPVAEAAPGPSPPADEQDEPEDEPVLDVVIGLPPPHGEP